MTENWLPVVGYEDLYEVSDHGRVWSVRREIFLKLVQRKESGHMFVCLMRNGERISRKVCHLVLEAFVGPRPDGLEACHGDDVSTHNRLSNLRWDTKSANGFDQVRNGRNFNANKESCANGHEYTSKNTRIYVTKDGHTERYCKECKRNSEHKRRLGLKREKVCAS